MPKKRAKGEGISLHVKPLKVQPLTTPIRYNPTKSLVDKKSIVNVPLISEKNDGPACSREQIRNYQENWDKILPPKVIRQLKHTNDVMHGAFSTNMQLPPEYQRDTHDIDVWSKKPGVRARQIEKKIDKCVGCDIAHVKEERVGKKVDMLVTPGPPKLHEETDDEKYKRYTVVTRPKDDVDVDYSHFPDDRPLHTVRVRGVRHETLLSAYERAQELKHRPMRAGRAYADIERIKKYYREKKGRSI